MPGAAFPELAKSGEDAVASVLPLLPPLGISFFVFEFVHYLIEIRRGHRPIRSPLSFALFTSFWPSLVAGPIKRYRQYVVSLSHGARNVSSDDVLAGMLRLAIGICKKFLGDVLTGWIQTQQASFDAQPLSTRWIIVVAIGFRILLDFSGYSDMAIGFARMMGIRLPENFNWPYLAHSISDFWRRWHISLSTWIRDYIYIRDVVGGYLRLAEAMDNPEVVGRAYNFSVEQPLSVLQLTTMILNVMGREDLQPVILNEARAEIQEQQLSAARARRELAWTPQHTLQGSLAETVLWYRDYFLAHA